MKAFVKKLKAVNAILFANTYFVYTQNDSKYNLFLRLNLIHPFEEWMNENAKPEYYKLENGD